MEKEFDYSLVPYVFMHCIHTSCTRANNCLRQKAMRHVPTETVSVSILNPALTDEDGENCNYFFADRKVKFALGMTQMLDKLPYRKAREIKRALYAHFDRSMYYRILNKERYIKPSEQNYIRKLFLQKGITEEPIFDSYVDHYDF